MFTFVLKFLKHIIILFSCLELPRIVVSPFYTYSHTHVTAGIAVSVVYTHITGHGKSVILMSLTFTRQEQVFFT